MNDDQIIKQVNDKITEYSKLYARMDKTKSRIEGLYVFKDLNNNKVDRAIHETRNTAKWQAKTMSDKLLKLKWQTVVESNNKLPKTLRANLERFSDDVWAQVDEFVADDYGMLDSWNCDKIITRGRIGVRWWLYYDKIDKLVIDCVPFDMRWCPYEINEWYCNRTWWNTEKLKAKYGEKIKVSSPKAEVWEFADKEKQQLFVGAFGSDRFSGDKIAEKSFPFGTGAVPFVVAKTSIGFGFRDDGYFEHDGETYDYLDRDEYDSANRHASIASTLAMSQFTPAWAQEKLDGTKIADPPPTLQTNTPYNKGEIPIRQELGELTQAFAVASQTIDQDINRGGITDTESGNLPGSDTALLTTVRNALLEEKQKPFRDALATFKQKSMRMIIDQYIKLGEAKGKKEVELGVEGMTHRFKASDLGDPSTYRISYIPMMNSKDQNIANVAIANAQKGILPARFILEETLQVQDPDGMLRELEMEKAKALDPSIGLIEQAIAFAEQAEDLQGIDADIANMKSMNLYDQAVTILRQRDAVAWQAAHPMTAPIEQPNQPMQTKPQEEAKSNTQGLLALTGGGKGSTPTTTAKVIAK